MIKDESHFKTAFIGGTQTGYVLHLDDYADPALHLCGLLRQKYDNHHLCAFVFEASEDALNERRAMPKNLNISIKEINGDDIRMLLSQPSQAGTLIFLRDRNKIFSLLSE